MDGIAAAAVAAVLACNIDRLMYTASWQSMDDVDVALNQALVDPEHERGIRECGV